MDTYNFGIPERFRRANPIQILGRTRDAIEQTGIGETDIFTNVELR
jgi:hypothetical protein